MFDVVWKLSDSKQNILIYILCIMYFFNVLCFKSNDKTFNNHIARLFLDLIYVNIEINIY